MDTKAAFEKWLVDGLEPNGLTAFMLVQKRDSGSYQLDHVNEKWGTWQASRAAIEIELDGEVRSGDDYYDDGYRAATDAAEEAITSHGIRIKGKTE